MHGCESALWFVLDCVREVRYISGVGTRVKIITPGMSSRNPSGGSEFGTGDTIEHAGMDFIGNADLREYDWLVVYDDLPKHPTRSMSWERETLACPREHTILITVEPPTIRLYSACYTRQFAYVLTTHDAAYLPHKGRRISNGSMRWCVDYTAEEVFRLPNWKKSKLISTCCSLKQMKHTRHYERLVLTRYLAAHLPELDWYGWGINRIKSKQTALNEYKYHVAVENYIHPHHWSDKISDPILAQCLTFYAGDPTLSTVLPEGCFIPIPIDDPPMALDIIRQAMRNGEYEKRLPQIREAQKLIATRYNMFDRVAAVIREHESASADHHDVPRRQQYIYGRHRLRCNPLNAIGEALQLLHYRVLKRAT